MKIDDLIVSKDVSIVEAAKQLEKNPRQGALCG